MTTPKADSAGREQIFKFGFQFGSPSCKAALGFQLFPGKQACSKVTLTKRDQGKGDTQVAAKLQKGIKEKGTRRSQQSALSKREQGKGDTQVATECLFQKGSRKKRFTWVWSAWKGAMSPSKGAMSPPICERREARLEPHLHCFSLQ
eukprot:1161827-Pelagomonas_calceolata.AAC.16